MTAGWDWPRGRGPFIVTASRRRWPLLSPRAEEIHWPDIAEHLAKINRYNGGTTACTYSVAQHSCLVADSMSGHGAAYGLLHDAHEAATGDITMPMKAALESLGGVGALREIENRQDRAIYKAARLHWPAPPRIAKEVKIADTVAVATETRDFMGAKNGVFVGRPLPPPWPKPIRPWSWPRAAEEWLDRLYRFLPHTRPTGA